MLGEISNGLKKLSGCSCVSSRPCKLDDGMAAAWTALPSLALPAYDSSDCLFFSLAEDRLYDLRFPPSHRPRLFASPSGWMLALHCFGAHPAALVDPVSHAVVRLPDLYTCFTDPNEPIQAQSSSSKGNDAIAWDYGSWADGATYAVAVSCGKSPFVWRSGDDSWAPVDIGACSPATTINYQSGYFFVFGARQCTTAAVDAKSLSVVARINPPKGPIAEACLVASSRDILLLTSSSPEEMVSKVFRVDFSFWRALRDQCANWAPRQGWSEVRDVGDRALFIDKLHGFSVATNGGGGELGVLRRNCIYSICSKPEQDSHGRKLARYCVSVFDVKHRRSGELNCDLSRHLIAAMRGEASWIIPRSLLPVDKFIPSSHHRGPEA